MCLFSHKFGKVEADGFQYCSSCGKAVKPSIPHPCANGHIWETQTSGKIIENDGGTIQGRYYVLRCKTCGEINKRSLELVR